MSGVRQVTAEVKSTRERYTEFLCRILQVFAVVSVVILFSPGLNPARMTGYIRDNVSLFTCGVSYTALTRSMGRALNQGWISYSSIRIIFAAGMTIIIATILSLANACMSLGNLRLKNKGAILAMISGIMQLFASVGLLMAYASISNTDRPDKVNPIFPNAVYVYIVLGAVMFLIAVTQIIIQPKAPNTMNYYMAPKYKLFLMFLPIVILAFLFSYLPLLGWRYAFFDYKAGEQLSINNFVGLKWFTLLFKNEATRNDIVRVLKNTLAMSGLGMLTSMLPMAFAIFLSEIRNNKFRRFVQTLTTIPNFISWVLVYAIALAIFSTDGFINTFRSQFGPGVYSINYLMNNSQMWIKMLLWGLWKTLGWSAIIYISAISSIDRQLFEASIVDGAGRFQRMWYITAPSLLPTYFVLLLMSIANILSNGMEQYLVFSNAMNKSSIEVLDLYVYNLGIGNGAIPLSTVVGMMKTFISVILLFTANGFSKRIRGESIV
ncbi:MAG: sugar ABC transporter permease [Anaerolineaceae bacterium]|nr:MAG: sugar ABC transporter permease [Anaerolineaceae bacterium]